MCMLMGELLMGQEDGLESWMIIFGKRVWLMSKWTLDMALPVSYSMRVNAT